MAVRYEYLEHTADIGLIAYGDSKEELFQNAAVGMYAFITGREYCPEQGDIEESIRLEAPSLEGLLVSWLNELLFIVETRAVLFTRFSLSIHDRAGGGAALTGTVSGITGVRTTKEIKAATYHDLAVKEEGTTYRAQIIFDV